MKIDKDKLKESLTCEQVFSYIEELGGQPQMSPVGFISRTICHNAPGTGSYKLYYYENSHLFKCFTSCNDSVDIYDITRRIKKMAGQDWSLKKAIKYVASYFGYSEKDFDFDETRENLQDWDFFSSWNKNSSVEDKQIVQMKEYDEQILEHLPQPRILPWEEEGISPEIIKRANIHYDPVNQGIVIPHYDIDGNLIGIRERTLIKEEEVYGKYKPAVLNGKMYNHPLSFSLYNLNNSKDNIKKIKKVFVGEGEKFCLKYASWFGTEGDISVACCGSSLISYQVKLLLSLGVEEIIVSFDRQFQQIGDEEFKKWTKKLTEINTKYSPYCNISFLFDKDGDLLGYKESPVDRDKETFLKLFERRITL